MNIEEKRQLVNNKLKKGDYALSNEDIFIITKTPELLNKLFDLLNSSENIWESSSIDRVIDELDFDFILNEDKDYSFLWYNVGLKKLADGDLDFLEEASQLLNGDYFEKLEQFVYLKLDEENYIKSNEFINDNILDFILKRKKYNILKNVSLHSIDINTFDKLMSCYKEKKFLFPNFSINSNLQDQITKKYEYENLPLEIMIKLYNKDKSHDKMKSIIDKIKSTPKELIPHDHSVWDDFFNSTTLTDNEKKQISDILFEKDYIDHYILNFYKEDNFSEETINKIANIIRNGEIIDTSLCGITYMYYNNTNLLKNDKIMKALIETGQLTIAKYSDNFSDYVDEIIKQIKDKNTYYKDLNIKINLVDYPKLFKAFIDEGNYSMLNNGTNVSLYYQNDFFANIIKDHLMNLLKNKNYDNIDDFRYINIYMDDLEFKNLLLESCKDNLYFASKIISYVPECIFKDKDLFNCFLTNELFMDQIIDYINHHEELEKLYNEETYRMSKNYFANKYNIDIEKLDKLENRFGPKIIRYIDNENIIKILSLDSIKLDKLIALFPKTNFYMSDAEAIYDSIKQYQFGKEYPEIINIFANINHSLQDKDNSYLEHISKIKTVMDDKFFTKFKSNYSNLYNIIGNNKDELIDYIIYKIKNSHSEEEIEYKNILHFITDYYIATKREEYRKTYNMFTDLNLPYKYDEKDLKKNFLYLMLETDYYLNVNNIYAPLTEHLIKKLENLGLDESLVKDCRLYYLNKGNTNINYNHDLKTIQNHLGIFVKETTKILNEKCNDKFKNGYIFHCGYGDKIKKNYYVKNNDLDLYNLLSMLRIDLISDALLSDDNIECFNSLVTTMTKYKLHNIPEEFNNLLNLPSINIDWNPSNIAGFINFYSKIYYNEKKRIQALGKSENEIVLSIINTFINANIYSSCSSVYSQFLGEKDCNLIKSNPGPNSATKKLKEEERLQEAINLTINNFKKSEVTIPTFNEVITFNSDKERKNMRVIVGNFTHPSNLTHGERTGACMRIGGVGESLFEFCLKDKNGFHIRFENPENNEYISRVSGFRNGNTVFLNELRYSCDKENYSDLDVVEVCRKVAQKLIEKSKDSSCPIDNVVICKAYAMDYTNDQIKHLGVNNIKEGLNNFYSDVSNSAIILATSKENNELVPINFDKSNVPSYLPARELIKEANDNSLVENINRVHSINAALKGEDYEYVEPLIFEESLIYTICNQDWYIYVDSNNKIHSEIINIDPRAKKEYDIAYSNVCEMYNVKTDGDKVVK